MNVDSTATNSRSVPSVGCAGNVANAPKSAGGKIGMNFENADHANNFLPNRSTSRLEELVLKLKIVALVECDSCYGTETEEIDWLLNDILRNKKDRLILHSNDIGDEIGEVTILSVEVQP